MNFIVKNLTEIIFKCLKVKKLNYFLFMMTLMRWTVVIIFRFRLSVIGMIFNKILCIGDKETDGELIEFASDTFAKVRDNQLSAIYIKLNFI